ncbi:MAG: hypothetical protein K8T20_03860 [Planctomycetes bacterium]|nr:hypothetical protein [Planctomycetota bacterium]
MTEMNDGKEMQKAFQLCASPKTAWRLGVEPEGQDFTFPPGTIADVFQQDGKVAQVEVADVEYGMPTLIICPEGALTITVEGKDIWEHLAMFAGRPEGPDNQWPGWMKK